MNSVFIITTDQEYFNLFTINYGHLPIHFTWFQKLDEIESYIELERPVYLFLVSDHIEELVEWISQYRERNLQPPFICFTGRLDYTDRNMLWQSGTVDIIRFPVHRKEMEYILQSFIDVHTTPSEQDNYHLTGRLDDFSFLDLIQTFEKSGKGGLLALQNGAQQGQIEFLGGKIVNARYQEFAPMEAMKIMSMWKRGQFHGKFDTEKREDKISVDNARIVKECLQYQKEFKELLRKLPDGDQKIYTEPELEYEEFGPKDRKWLHKFRKGYSLEEFLAEYSGDVNSMLRKFLFWIEQRWLLDREAHRFRKAQIQAEERRSKLSKIMSKLFSKSSQELQPPAIHFKKDLSEEETIVQEMQMKPYLFRNVPLLQHYIQDLEAEQ